jgi:hypothetical protein
MKNGPPALWGTVGEEVVALLLGGLLCGRVRAGKRFFTPHS